GGGVVVGEGGRAAAARRLVMRLDEQPVLALLARAATHAHEMPRAGELLAVEREIELALLEPALGIALGLPGAAIPDHHGAAAVLALRDDAFALVVFDRVVLAAHRQP